MFMKQGFWVFLLIFLMACQTKNSNLQYTIHTKNSGPKAELGKFLTLNMSYKNEQDSIIFNSFQRQKPLTFKFSKTLFKGALNEGLFHMAAGDSATFQVPIDSLYDEHIPSFTKSGENLKYTIKLLSITDAPDLEHTNSTIKVRKSGGK